VTGGERERPIVGEHLAHYRVIERLASGGMGEIYLAEDTRLERRVALKVLSAETVANTECLQRFRTEAKAIATMNHPNIVTIHGVEEDRGIHFIAMEFVEGRTLRKVIPDGGLPLAEFFQIAEQLTEAVAVAHGRGITHRDLKPDNVMVTPSGHVKVLDFGLAKLVGESREQSIDAHKGADLTHAPSARLTENGALLGTIPYMSPEQVAGGEIDHRSDLFSLGIILYEMLAGERPFKARSASGVISAILREPFTPVSRRRRDIPRPIELAIDACLEKDPAERMQSASSLHEQLRLLRREYSSGVVSSDGRHANRGAEPSGPWRQPAARVRHLADHSLPLLLLGAVFLVNLVETTVEAAVRDRWGVGRELGYRLAHAAHWFEGSITAEAYDTASPVVVYGYSTAYFFALMILVVATGWALARSPGRHPFRIFALTITADYAISLPFFLFFPVPERWAYPESGAILLSDLWEPFLIEAFRPISGLDNCFPSFHVSLTVAMVGLCFLFGLRLRWSALWLGLLVIVSTSVLGIHWVTDIGAGVATGILAVATALLIDRRLPWPRSAH
jgi:serine/threonine protein kinase/membrane-associated phospholipid phosphatase